MGTIFHRCKMIEDAIIILGAAVDHNPNIAANHFMLANAYAVCGDYNNSLRHLEACININSDFDLAKKHKYGVFCHSLILDKMIAAQA